MTFFDFFRCGTHFCYLCCNKLPSINPYSHFSLTGGECFNQLFEGNFFTKSVSKTLKTNIFLLFEYFFRCGRSRWGIRFCFWWWRLGRRRKYRRNYDANCKCWKYIVFGSKQKRRNIRFEPRTCSNNNPILVWHF